MSSDYTTLSITTDTKPVFDDAKQVVSDELGENVTQSETIRELAEAYRGGDALGRWQDNE